MTTRRTPVPWDRDVLGVLLAPTNGTTLAPWLREALAAGLGGVVLFGHNTPDLPTTRRLVADMRAAAPRPPIIAIDEEGGRVTRLWAERGAELGPPVGSTVPGPLPTARTMGIAAGADGRTARADGGTAGADGGVAPASTAASAADPLSADDVATTHGATLLTAAGEALGEVLAGLGIDLDFAPVADVHTNPANPVIGDRAFATTAAEVARCAAAFAAGLHRAGVASCAKHFPGHGDTAVDSHVSLPTVDLSAERMRADHVEAFAALARDHAVDAVMTAHIAVPALGEGPASISPWSKPLLDEIGFEGLVITDALDMGAITETRGFAGGCVAALHAGADLLCLGTAIRRDDAAMLREAHDAILAAIEDGQLDRADIASRAKRAARIMDTRRGGDPQQRLADDTHLAALEQRLRHVGDQIEKEAR